MTSKARNLSRNCEDTAALVTIGASFFTADKRQLIVGVLDNAAIELRRLADIEEKYNELKFRMDGLEK